MNVYCIVNQTMRLSDPTRKLKINEPLAYSNAKAHSFRVTVLAENGDSAADLTGVSCSGQFMSLKVNETIAPIPGTVTGNVCEVILPESCYLKVGRFRFTMDLLCAVPADGVPEFSTTTNYVVGDRVAYNGKVYVFTSNHSAGAWDSEDADIETENRTALWVEGTVERNIDGTIIDPGTPVGNITTAINNTTLVLRLKRRQRKRLSNIWCTTKKLRPPMPIVATVMRLIQMLSWNCTKLLLPKMSIPALL